MKNTRIVLIVTIVLLLILMGGFYFTSYTSFTGSTLDYIEIHHTVDSKGSEEESHEVHSGKYRIAEEDHELFLQSLASIEENGRDNPSITVIDDIDTEVQSTLISFSLQLVNRYNQQRIYTIYLENENMAYIEFENSFYKIEDADLYYTHPAFNPYYKIKYLPKIELSNDIIFDIEAQDSHWQIQRYDGSWIDSRHDEYKNYSVEVEQTSSRTDQQEDRLKLSFDEEPVEINYVVLNPHSNEKVNIKERDDLEQEALPIAEVNGEYNYQLEVFWDEDLPRKTKLSFNAEVSLPINFIVDNSSIVQDEVIEIIAERAASAEDLEVEGPILEDLQWHREGGQLKTIIATNYHTEPGVYSLKFKDIIHEKTHDYSIEILPREYKTQYLSIDPSIEAQTRNEEAYAEREQYFSDVWKESSENRYYEEAFILPTEGRLTTEFGERRYVNDELTSYRHNGIDIAAPTGTEILATNHGEVVFEREMILMGNTIVIDHGHGILSTYLHLHEIHVEEGEQVEKGEVIGTVGTTGFSTGPHLHFTLSYYDVPIEPGYFIIGNPYTKEEHYHIRR